VKEVRKGTAKMESLRDDGLRWKAKYMAATENVRVKTRQITQELDETKRHLLATEETNEGLVKAVSNGITKWERVREDRLRWKTKYFAGLEDVRVRGEQLAQAEQAIRDLRKAGRSETKRAADLQAELLIKLDVAELQAKVFVPTLLFFSSCVSALFLLASFYPFHLILCYKADEKYQTKLEEKTKENKRRRRQAEAKCDACKVEINETKERHKVRRQQKTTEAKTRQHETSKDKTRQEKARQDTIRQDQTRQHKPRQHTRHKGQTQETHKRKKKDQT
jgi:hypothetical protein